jgi:alanine-synthesizing transaminase
VFSKRSAHDARKNALALALAASPPRYDLSVANPTTAGLSYPSSEIAAALDNEAGRFYVPDPRGLLHAREAVSQYLAARALRVAPEHVFISSGTSEAYAHLFALLCDAGDDVLVPQPSYPLFEHLARLSDVTLSPYPLRYDGEWHIDLGALRGAIGPRTRAVMIVSPNNPTGSYLKRDELEALHALGLPLISDEVFAEYPLRDDSARAPRASSALQLDGSLVFSLFGLSKLAALPQWKVAWTCLRGPSALVEQASERLELIYDTFLSTATATQRALPRLLELTQPTRRALHARLLRNLAALRGQLGPSSPLSVLDVEGGFYATVRLPRTQSEERWVLDFLELDGVYVQPGYYFDFADEAYVVLSLLTPEPVFDEGVARIVRRVGS